MDTKFGISVISRFVSVRTVGFPKDIYSSRHLSQNDCGFCELARTCLTPESNQASSQQKSGEEIFIIIISLILDSYG